MSGLAESLGPFRRELEMIDSGEIAVDSPLTKGVGAQHGVVGLLDAVLEQAGTKLEFDPSRGGTAAKLSRRARRDGNVALARVLRVYRDVTRMYPDVLGTGYGGTPDDFEEFRRSIVPRLLDAVADWAAEHDEGAVSSIRALELEWDAAVGSLLG